MSRPQDSPVYDIRAGPVLVAERVLVLQHVEDDLVVYGVFVGSHHVVYQHVRHPEAHLQPAEVTFMKHDGKQTDLNVSVLVDNVHPSIHALFVAELLPEI